MVLKQMTIAMALLADAIYEMSSERLLFVTVTVLCA